MQNQEKPKQEQGITTEEGTASPLSDAFLDSAAVNVEDVWTDEDYELDEDAVYWGEPILDDREFFYEDERWSRD